MQKQIQVPDEIQAKVDQFMANARARFGHGVWRMDANDQGGNQGGSQGGDGSDGGGQNQDQGQGGSILDREAEGGDQGSGGGEGGEGNQGGSGEGGNVDVNAIVTQVTQALEQRFDSIADRRVNAILREVRGNQQGGGGQGGQGQQGGGDSGQQGGSQGGSSGPAAGDVREARLVYREYVGDQVKFLGDFEREAASNLAQGLLASRLAAGDDPETAGREAARQVATTVKGLRKQYESRIMAALRRDGLIPADAGQGGQPLPGPSKPGDQSGYQAGAAKAQQLLAHRLPQTQTQQ